MAITKKEELKRIITLTKDESLWFENSAKYNCLPFRIPSELADKLTYDEIRKQFVPTIEEFRQSTLTLDPQNEEEFSPIQHLVHRYSNRVAFKVTDRCFGYCRYCFRRRMIEKENLLSEKEINDVCDYLKKNSTNDMKLEEILITGGDPLTLSTEILQSLLFKLREASPRIIIRLCTRALCTFPERFDDELLDILEEVNDKAPLFILTQFNSHLELTQKVETFTKKISKRGILMFNQSVLLKGVNDNVKALHLLSRRLLMCRIKPYYLFLCDDVKGTEHFFVSKEKALELENSLREVSSGLEMPTFMKDLPCGGGKIPLWQLFLV